MERRTQRDLDRHDTNPYAHGQLTTRLLGESEPGNLDLVNRVRKVEMQLAALGGGVALVAVLAGAFGAFILQHLH